MPTASVTCWLTSRTATASEALSDVLVTLLSVSGAAVGAPIAGAICFGPSGDGSSALWSLEINATQAAQAVARFSSVQGNCSGVVELTEARIALRESTGLTPEQAGQLTTILSKLNGTPGTPPVVISLPDGKWEKITPDHLKSAGHGAVIDRAQTLATGTIDPVAQEIANAVSRVRSAVKAGNKLDADKTKVPASLVGLTVRIALFLLMERLRFPLNVDQKTTKTNDNSYLLRITDKKERFETPDVTAEDGGEMQTRPAGSWNSENPLIMRTHPVPRPAQQFPATTGNYATEDGR